MRNLFPSSVLRWPRLTVLLLLLLVTQAWSQEATYNSATNIVTIPAVRFGNATYTNVTLANIGNFTFTFQGATPQVPAGPAAAVFDGTVLTLPSVRVGAISYAAILRHIGNLTFTLQSATEVQTYIYYSKTVHTPQIATLYNGTLSMDGMQITDFSFGAAASDSSGQLVQWASPWNNYNQPVVQAMLFCGGDEKLAYVLMPREDTARVASTALDLVTSIHDASQYDGVSIYRNCFGSFSDKWLNNLPNANYFLWSDTFTTYSSAFVMNQLSGAVILREQGQPSNQHNFLGITWRGNIFEVWQ
ncbi:MAG: hypothetical protein JWQ07_4199 [Ramlibacter sp.]|nr:hypothetical protein [Ramlibacter sp.]